MSELNTSLVYLSLKYIKRKYISVIRVSKWIYFELIKFNYKESKFIKSLNEKDIDIIKILIRFNKNKNLLSEYLDKYCSCNCVYIVKLLLENGADVHYKDNYILRFASGYGRFDMVKLLLDNGANIHGEDDGALKLASLEGHLSIVKLLVDNGANIHAQNNIALWYAERRGQFEVVKFLRSLL